MKEQNRLSTIRTGKGDLGISEVVSGYKIRKDSYICSLQNELQFLRNNIYEYKLSLEDEIFIHSNKIDPYKEIFNQNNEFNYIKKQFEILDVICLYVINTISASAYYKFEKNKFMVYPSFIEKINKELENLKQEHIECPEFFIPSLKISLLGDNVTTEIRKVETHFWSAVFEIYNQYDKQMFKHEDNEIVNNIAKFLNMLSDYMFLYNRYVHFTFSDETYYWKNEKSVS